MDIGSKIKNIRSDHKTHAQTILLITHDQSIAENSRRIIVIEDGKIIRDNRS